MTDNHANGNNHPIDVVIAWVDGNDPYLAEKRASYLEPSSVFNIKSGAHSTRFASNNEIRYCVLSVLKFAPFVRNIFIITDDQDPDLNDIIKAQYPERLNSIRIVDHKEIFEGFEDSLPTFNSISIGNMIWRIKGLSENFVYFNDDTFLVREIEPEDWFIQNKPVLRGKWIMAPLLRILWNYIRVPVNKYLLGHPEYQPRASFHMGQWGSASILGHRLKYFTNSHTPHTVGLNLVKDFFEKERKLFQRNISYRFRNYKQFTFISLSNHLQLISGNKHVAEPGLVYMKPYSRPQDYIDKKIKECETNKAVKYLCVQSLDMCNKEEQKKIGSWLESILG
jgi:hypothetical protein